MKSLSILLGFLIIALLVWHASLSLREAHHPQLAREQFNHPFWAIGTVVGLPSIASHHRTRFIFKTKQGKFLLDWYGRGPRLEPGDTWRLLIELKPIGIFHNPGEFDYASFLQRQGIIAKGYVLPKYYYHRLHSSFWAQPLNCSRYKLRERLLQATRGEVNQGVMIALVLGDKSGLSSKAWQILVNSGTSYFVVISGLHIALLAGIIFLFLRWVWPIVPNLALIIPAQKAAGIAGLIAALIYSMLAGFTVPTQRAFITITVLGLARLLERNISSYRAWFAALCIVLLWDPLSVYEVGFWLSFLAVWFLLFTYMGRIGPPRLWHKWVYPQWVIFWGILPISLLYFQQVSMVSLITNIIAIPMMMLLIIPGALFGTLMLFIWPSLGALILHYSSLIMDILWWILQYFATREWWGLYLPEPSILLTALGILGAVLILSPKAVPARWLGLIFLLPLFIGLHKAPDLGQAEVQQLNVPDGKLLVIRTTKHIWVDQVNSNNREAYKVAREILLPYLRSEGINKIDLWVIDSPNPVNLKTFSQVLTGIKVNLFEAKHFKNAVGFPVKFCSPNEIWQWDGVSFSLSNCHFKYPPFLKEG
ncbi:MAG: internalization-related competence protein ComEC/Rec2 [Gammaproteobacteria bacterium]|jgi:competence protein ComEC|nr:internalization-related competence protein ComEC/Rec2 [Gammaproteobacteria bacterium]